MKSEEFDVNLQSRKIALEHEFSLGLEIHDDEEKLQDLQTWTDNTCNSDCSSNCCATFQCPTQFNCGTIDATTCRCDPR